MTNHPQNTPDKSGEWLDEVLEEVYATGYNLGEWRKDPSVELIHGMEVPEAKTAILAHIQAEVLAGRQGLVDELVRLVLPLTDDYSSGWNDCLRRLSANLQKRWGNE